MAAVLASATEQIPTQSRPAKRRLDYIDALRGAACLWVILHHIFEHKPVPNGPWHYPASALVYLANIGWLGVSLFLVLSGFCLFYPLAARYNLSEIQLNIATFARRRALRILPPYYAAFVLTAAFEIVDNRRHSGHWDWRGVLEGPQNILMHLFMLQNLTAKTLDSVNDAYWSLSLESQLYLIFPLLVWAAGRFGLKSILAGTLLVSLGWQLFCFHRFGFSLYWTPELAVYYHALPARCFEFAAGMTAAYFVTCPIAAQKRVALFSILLLIVPALYFVLIVSRFGPLCDQVWGIIFAATLVLLGQVSDARFQQNLGLRCLVWIGAISYSVYLMHGVFVGILAPNLFHVPGRLDRDYLIGLAQIPVIVGFCYLFHLAFERPFMPGRPRTERQAEVAAAVSPAP